MATSSSSTEHQAHKQHECAWCGQNINVGEKYRSWSVFNRGASRCKAHQECYSAMMESTDNEFVVGGQVRGVSA